MEQQIQSNVLKGVFYNLNKIIFHNQKRLDSKLSESLEKTRDIPIAIENFAMDVASELFGGERLELKNAFNILIKEYKETMLRMQWGYKGDIWDHWFRTVLSRVSTIAKKDLIYEPRTGRNNLDALSGVFIGEINGWLRELYKEPHFKLAESKQEISKLVRRIFILVIMTLLQTIALKRIYLGREVEKKVMDAYKITNSRLQYTRILELTEKEKLPVYGSILFRALSFGSGGLPIEVLRQYLKQGWIAKGTAWSPDWTFSNMYINKCGNKFQNPKKFNEFRALFEANKSDMLYIDRKNELEKIVDYIVKHKDKHKMLSVRVMLSYPIINSYSKQRLHEPVQFLNHLSSMADKGVREVFLLPNSFKLTDCSIDALVSFYFNPNITYAQS